MRTVYCILGAQELCGWEEKERGKTDENRTGLRAGVRDYYETKKLMSLRIRKETQSRHRNKQDKENEAKDQKQGLEKNAPQIFGSSTVCSTMVSGNPKTVSPHFACRRGGGHTELPVGPSSGPPGTAQPPLDPRPPVVPASAGVTGTQWTPGWPAQCSGGSVCSQILGEPLGPGEGHRYCVDSPRSHCLK